MRHFQIFSRIGYFVAIATIMGLMWLSLGPAGLDSNPKVAQAAGDPVIAAAGDIACDPTNSNFNSGNGTSGSCRQKYTSDLLVNAGLSAVLPLGDNQYYCGGYQAYLQSYDLSWGLVKSITHPVVGNHEYLTSGGTDCTVNNTGAAGYFNYFGVAAGAPSQGYYSYDIGTWHLIAINSNCGNAGGCSASSPQGQWLAADLAAHQNFCTLAYWHIPLFSSGGRASTNTKAIWQILYDNNADLILSGHDHIYERFAPQTPDGVLDTARGIREFIIGSGGANHTSLATIFANSEVRNTDTYGVLKLTLHPTSYDWQFVPEAGKTFTDSGTQVCHGSGPAPTATPTGSLVATNTPTVTSTGVASPTSTPTLANTPTATPAGNTFTFTPAADAYIYQTNGTTNFGSATSLQVDNSPVKNILLKFNVSGLNGQPVTSAKLRLFDVDPSSKGGDFYRVSDNTWQEGTVTWNNAPAADTTLLASLGAVQVGNWYEVNLTSLITGDGTYSLRVSSTSSDGADFSSKEGANPPQLVIQTQPLSTATATSSGAFTSTPTATSTFTPTATSPVPSTPTNTQTPTPTNTIGASPAPTDTPTATPTPTNTVAVPPSPTDTPTATPTPTNTVAVPPSPTATQTPTATPTQSGTALTYVPVADAYVNAGSPTSNFGSATNLRTDASPDVHSYLRFDVQGLSGTVTKATLRIFANSASTIGCTADSVSDNTWAESTIIYNNAPPVGSALGSSGPFGTGVWISIDVTSYITGNGTYNLALTTPSSTNVSYGSREAGANAPQLIIETVP